jgi:hypothetical protein
MSNKRSFESTVRNTFNFISTIHNKHLFILNLNNKHHFNLTIEGLQGTATNAVKIKQGVSLSLSPNMQIWKTINITAGKLAMTLNVTSGNQTINPNSNITIKPPTFTLHPKLSQSGNTINIVIHNTITITPKMLRTANINTSIPSMVISLTPTVNNYAMVSDYDSNLLSDLDASLLSDLDYN